MYWPWSAKAKTEDKILPEVMLGVEKLIKTAEHHGVFGMKIEVRYHRNHAELPYSKGGFDLTYSVI